MGLLNAKPMLEFEAYIKPVGGLLIREGTGLQDWQSLCGLGFYGLGFHIRRPQKSKKASNIFKIPPTKFHLSQEPGILAFMY